MNLEDDRSQLMTKHLQTTVPTMAHPVTYRSLCSSFPQRAMVPCPHRPPKKQCFSVRSKDAAMDEPFQLLYREFMAAFPDAGSARERA